MSHAVVEKNKVLAVKHLKKIMRFWFHQAFTSAQFNVGKGVEVKIELKERLYAIYQTRYQY